MRDATDERLRSLFTELAGVTPPAPSFDELVASTHTRRLVLPRPGLGIAATALAVAAVVLVMATDTGTSSRVVTAGQPQASTTVATPGAANSDAPDAMVTAGATVVRVHSTSSCNGVPATNLCVSGGAALRQAPLIESQSGAAITFTFDGGTVPDEVTATAVSTGGPGRPQPSTVDARIVSGEATLVPSLPRGEYYLIVFTYGPQSAGGQGQYLLRLKVTG